MRRSIKGLRNFYRLANDSGSKKTHDIKKLLQMIARGLEYPSNLGTELDQQANPFPGNAFVNVSSLHSIHCNNSKWEPRGDSFW